MFFCQLAWTVALHVQMPACCALFVGLPWRLSFLLVREDLEVTSYDCVTYSLGNPKCALKAGKLGI